MRLGCRGGRPEAAEAEGTAPNPAVLRDLRGDGGPRRLGGRHVWPTDRPTPTCPLHCGLFGSTPPCRLGSSRRPSAPSACYRSIACPADRSPTRRQMTIVVKWTLPPSRHLGRTLGRRPEGRSVAFSDCLGVRRREGGGWRGCARPLGRLQDAKQGAVWRLVQEVWRIQACA